MNFHNGGGTGACGSHGSFDPGRLAVRVDDTEAAYPIRIDPTFSDADWIALNPDAAGLNVQGVVQALALNDSGNLYVGG